MNYSIWTFVKWSVSIVHKNECYFVFWIALVFICQETRSTENCLCLRSHESEKNYCIFYDSSLFFLIHWLSLFIALIISLTFIDKEAQPVVCDRMYCGTNRHIKIVSSSFSCSQ